MRIVLSNASTKWGGVHKVTEMLALGLQAIGHELRVFGTARTPLEDRMRRVAAFIPILGGADLDPVVVARANRALHRYNADVVVTLTKKDVRQTAISAAAAGIPVVVRHANDQPLHDNLFWKTLYGRIPALHITNAEATKRTLLASAPWLDERKVRVIYNGVDAEAYQRATPIELGLPGDAIVAGFAGSFEERKGVKELAIAWHRVAAAIPDAYLVLAGKGSMEEEMRRLLAGAPRVLWAGYRTDMPQVLRSFDMLVLPSHVEGAPNIVLEAMSAGAAVLATRVSGTPELVTDGVHGTLIEPRDSGTLAASMIAMLRDAEMRERYSKAALERVRKEFTPERMLAEYDRALKGAISAQVTRKM